MPISHIDTFIGKLIEALGLPDHCVSFTLKVELGQAVQVECTYMPDIDRGVAETITEQFQLVGKES